MYVYNIYTHVYMIRICGALRDLLPFVQFEKREKHPWRSVNFSKVAGLKPATLLKLTLVHGCFPRFLNCTNGTISRNTPHVISLFDLGLDPAAPYYENEHIDVRLDPTDADFVDVIHTDSKTIIIHGFGTIQRMGHVDFFPNGGFHQIGCWKLDIG